MHFMNAIQQFIHRPLAFAFKTTKFYRVIIANSSFIKLHSYTTKIFLMIHFFTNRKTYALSILMCVVAFINLNLNAQNVLVGLTSNGGINGKGTAFSINTNGSNFSLIN